MVMPKNEKKFLLKIYEIIKNIENTKPEDTEEKINVVLARYPEYKEIYKKYLTLEKSQTVFDQNKYIDLRYEPFLGLMRKCSGSSVDSWLILGDLNTYLLKQILKNKYIGEGSQETAIINSELLPIFIEKTRHAFCKILYYNFL